MRGHVVSANTAKVRYRPVMGMEWRPGHAHAFFTLEMWVEETITTRVAGETVRTVNNHMAWSQSSDSSCDLLAKAADWIVTHAQADRS